MRSWFEIAVLCALGLGVSFISVLLLVQVQYTGTGAPFHALADYDVLAAVRLSLLVSVSAALLAALFAIPAGYGLSRFDFPGKALIEGLMVVPILMSPMALGVSLLLVFRTTTGQWIEDNLLGFVFEVPGMILAQFVVALSLETIIARNVFDSVAIRYEQVARFLGCTPWQAFRKVTLPLARKGLIAAVVLGWARAIGDFGATSMLAGAVRGKTETMPISIYLSMASVSLDRAVCLSVVLTMVTVLSLVIVQTLTRKDFRSDREDSP